MDEYKARKNNLKKAFKKSEISATKTKLKSKIK